MQIKVKLFATLREFAPPQAEKGVYMAEYPEGTTIVQIVDDLKIPREEAAIIMVNGLRAELPDTLKAGDTLSLFPLVAGG